MAFWSAELTQKEKLDTNDELEEGYMIQLSGASLTPAAKQGDKVFLYIQPEEDEPKIVAAVLVAGTSDYVSLNLVLPAGQGLVLSTSGANTPVHLTGSIQEDPALYGNPDLFDNEDEDDENEDGDDDDDDDENDDDEELDEEEVEAQLKLSRAKPAGSKIKEINDKETNKPAKGGKPSNDKHEEHPKAEEKAKGAETPKAAKHEEKAKGAETPKAAKHEEKAKGAETPKETNGNKRPASDGTEEKSDKKPKTAPNTPASGDLKCSCGKSFKVAGGLDAHKKSTGHK